MVIKIIEAIKCYFSLFMFTLNLTFLYYILFKPKIQAEKNFVYTCSIYLVYSKYTKYLNLFRLENWDISHLAVVSIN